MTYREFSKWLLDEIEKRGMTYSEVARLGGTTHGRVSQVISGENPGRKFCEAVARAFNLPREEVFRRAGFLPPAPEETATIAEVVYLMNQLPPEEQERLLITARSWIEAREREKKRGTQPKTSEAGI